MISNCLANRQASTPIAKLLHKYNAILTVWSRLLRSNDLQEPSPWKSLSAAEVVCNHVCNHLPLPLRFRQLHLRPGGVHVQAAPGLLPLPHVHPHVSDRHHVLDLVLGAAGGGAGPGHAGRHIAAHADHAALELAKGAAARLLYQG